jgi:putative salt-induced outer membrane protein YdiY
MADSTRTPVLCPLRLVLALLVLALCILAGAAPLQAQNWFDPSPPMTAHFMQGAVRPIAFHNAELNAEIAELKPTVVTEVCCDCGKAVSCDCGSCAECCHCPTGWHGWVRSWAGPWTGTLELGLNGANGNTNNSNLFFGWDGKREYRGGDLTFDFDYFYQKADSAVTMDRAVALGRYEREIGESSISWFVQGFFEYDDLRAYPGRVSVTAGLTKQLIETDRFKLTGRVGAGASKKIDAPDDDWRPELQFGADYEYKLTDRQRFFGFVDYYPDMSNFSTYRLNYKLAWEALLEEDWGLAMRASIMNWYDSDPGPGTKANDLYYVLALTLGY